MALDAVGFIGPRIDFSASCSYDHTRYCLAGFGVTAFLLTLFLLPETYHGKTPHQIACEERGVRFVPYWFNPFRSVLLLRWPNICMIVSSISLLRMVEFWLTGMGG